MLKNITIENFRCFKHTKISGFSTVNLIGGQNNSGKTSLLEALLIATYPEPASIEFFRKMRDIRTNNIETDTEKVWDYFFYALNKQNVIKFQPEFTDNEIGGLTIKSTNSLNDIVSDLPEIMELKKNQLFHEIGNNCYLQLAGKVEGLDFFYLLNPSKEKRAILSTGKSPSLRFEGLFPFIHSMGRLNYSLFIKSYSNVKEKGKLNILHDVLKMVDNRVAGTEIDAPGGGEPILKMILSDGQSYMMTAFGDGMMKIIAIILHLLDTSRNSVYIDEIENGIHYTRHNFFWKKIFEIAKELKIQIFATSHSLEMIRAFNEVAMSGSFADDAKYFEMARHAKTNDIFANAMDMEDLHYEITKNQTFRGE
jgi:AAA15 family ATPase/GTPase